MRDRDELDVQVKAVRDFAQQLSDNIELIELGEAEGDAAIVKEAESGRKVADLCCANGITEAGVLPLETKYAGGELSEMQARSSSRTRIAG